MKKHKPWRVQRRRHYTALRQFAKLTRFDRDRAAFYNNMLAQAVGGYAWWVDPKHPEWLLESAPDLVGAFFVVENRAHEDLESSEWVVDDALYQVTRRCHSSLYGGLYDANAVSGPGSDTLLWLPRRGVRFLTSEEAEAWLD